MTQRSSEFRVFDCTKPNVSVSVAREGGGILIAAGTFDDSALVHLAPGIANELAKAILQASQAAEAQQ